MLCSLNPSFFPLKLGSLRPCQLTSSNELAELTVQRQSDLLLRGQLSISPHSSLSLGERIRLVLGAEKRLKHRRASAPSLQFAREKLRLELDAGAQLHIEPGAHCLLLNSIRINSTQMTYSLGQDSVVWPWIVCFDSKQTADHGLKSVGKSETLCIRVPSTMWPLIWFFSLRVEGGKVWKIFCQFYNFFFTSVAWASGSERYEKVLLKNLFSKSTCYQSYSIYLLLLQYIVGQIMHWYY